MSGDEKPILDYAPKPPRRPRGDHNLGTHNLGAFFLGGAIGGAAGGFAVSLTATTIADTPCIPIGSGAIMALVYTAIAHGVATLREAATRKPLVGRPSGSAFLLGVACALAVATLSLLPGPAGRIAGQIGLLTCPALAGWRLVRVANDD